MWLFSWILAFSGSSPGTGLAGSAVVLWGTGDCGTVVSWHHALLARSATCNHQWELILQHNSIMFLKFPHHSFLPLVSASVVSNSGNQS